MKTITQMVQDGFRNATRNQDAAKAIAAAGKEGVAEAAAAITAIAADAHAPDAKTHVKHVVDRINFWLKKIEGQKLFLKKLKGKSIWVAGKLVARGKKGNGKGKDKPESGEGGEGTAGEGGESVVDGLRRLLAERDAEIVRLNGIIASLTPVAADAEQEVAAG
jgi:hypothetical protein